MSNEKLLMQMMDTGADAPIGLLRHAARKHRARQAEAAKQRTATSYQHMDTDLRLAAVG